MELTQPSVRDVAQRAYVLQARVEACVDVFRAHPRLSWRESGETDCVIDELMRLAGDSARAHGVADDRRLVYSIALGEATLLARLRAEADFAARAGHDAPWHRPMLEPMRQRLAELVDPPWLPPATPSPAASASDRQQLMERMTKELVRTMRSVPAPGVEPLSARDWALIWGMALLMALAFAGIVILSTPR